MNKTLAALTLTLAMTSTVLAFPVARQDFKKLDGPLAPIAVFTPQRTGLFRATLYVHQSVPGVNGAYVCPGAQLPNAGMILTQPFGVFKADPTSGYSIPVFFTDLDTVLEGTMKLEKGQEFTVSTFDAPCLGHLYDLTVIVEKVAGL